MREIKIGRAEEGQKLIRVLEKYLPAASSGFLYKMLRKKNIKLNKAKADGKTLLKRGDLIEIFFSEETMKVFTGEDKERSHRKDPLRADVRVLFRTEDILILHKPAGLLSQKAKADDDSLNDWLIDYCLENGDCSPESLKWFRPSIVNRLDRNTSGIVLAGRTAAGLKVLSALLRQRRVEKYYLAPTAGIPDMKGKLKGYLKKDSENNRVYYSENASADSAAAETGYELVEFAEDAFAPMNRGRSSGAGSSFPVSLLRIRLYTGKSHQIRAHLAAMGHPILGDAKYGDPDVNNRLRRQYGIRAQLLHSHELVIPEDIRELTSQGPDGFETGNHIQEHEYNILEELAGLRIKDPVPKMMNRVLEDMGIAQPAQNRASDSD